MAARDGSSPRQQVELEARGKDPPDRADGVPGRSVHDMMDRGPDTQLDRGEDLQFEILSLLAANAHPEEFTALLARIERLPADEARWERMARSVQLGMAVRQRLEEQQHREHGLMAVIETARDLTALRDIEQVLQAIVRRARQLVGCQIGYLSNYDRHRDLYYIRVTDGAVSEELRAVELKRGIGLIGLVEKTGAPQSSAGYEEDTRFTHSDDVDSIFRHEGIQSIVGVPLLVGGEVIGVLFVGDRYVRAFAPWEVSILSTLAAHAAVAIMNAHAFEDAQAALEQASRANALLQKQADGIQRAAAAHEELTSLVARGGGLADLCRVIAEMLGGTVQMLDDAARPLVGPIGSKAAEPSNQGRRGQKIGEHVRQALRESRVLGRSVAAHGSFGGSCRVAALVGGAGPLGGLVIWTDTDLDEFAVRIFERSAVITGVVLLSQERAALAANAERSAIVRGLLSWQQEDMGRLAIRAAREGVDLHGPFALAVAEIANRGASSLVRELRGLPGTETLLVDEIDGIAVLLSGGPARDSLRAMLARHIAAEHGKDVNAVVALAPSATELPQHYRNLRRCLGLLRAIRRWGCVATEAELSPYAVVFEKHDTEDIEALLTSVLGPLLEEDRRKGSALANTVLAYLDNGHNARRAAAALGIHVNTLRQRFEAVGHILGDWSETPRALDIHFALRLWKLRGA